MFSKSTKNGITPQDLDKAIMNLSAQEALLSQQLKDGSISQTQWQEEMQRSSSLKSSYRNNIDTLLDEQQSSYSPK
ncbi:hypothetical protein [Legionella quateirensis]|uniref:Uncharacterized protein n=1 Tax=Legionella quateirensis TaxID=45072 RepID=A0A378KS20_9GAMM|nr:hypothetical protein [Legionella quateirensis]KTD52879.1 hypothetical protein Lqua_0712 [Legionella quateirensis]STY16391.1 Uncharacterised protein [Legionella quateirensis]